jgi:hypothetical protein
MSGLAARRHSWLLVNIPFGVKSIDRKWLKSGYMEKLMLHPTEEGTPQLYNGTREGGGNH